MSCPRASLGHALSLPERIVRASAASLGGLLFDASPSLGQDNQILADGAFNRRTQ